MRTLALILALMPLPALSQTVPVDAASVASCRDGAAHGDVAPDCIGLAAQACQRAHSQPDTTLAISQCLMAEAAAWDDLLNDEYNALRDARPAQADTLLDAQRAWIALRDADCTMAYDIHNGGSMRAIAAADCQLRHTAIRTLQLRDMQPN
ncbi:lysozyme inhibitor LprI family protein [Paracoccus sp. PARArs4]|uniref:lysozyme inhibitor LprI family protein n=1 Tax=Paracoccus sp. PARArs4 TaxID=2853442 RepID=UPI0024A70FD6|nr:lysozyme inhibitor LprI family protein [Paracoccus sp. PARArs4]